jgi:hypothetical protein
MCQLKTKCEVLYLGQHFKILTIFYRNYNKWGDYADQLDLEFRIWNLKFEGQIWIWNL